MPDTSALARRIDRIFRDRLNLTVPDADTDLFENAILDSLSFVELLHVLETDFGLKVSLEEFELENFRSIARIATFLADREPANNAEVVEPAPDTRLAPLVRG